MIRRFLALARTALVEALAEPLSAVLFLSSMALVHLLPALHCHRFGEPGRLARECGMSAVLVFGLSFAVAAAVRTIGRELESGTAAVALAQAVPRPLFFCAKMGGVLCAFAVFSFAALAASALAVLSAEVAAEVAATHGDSSRTWGPGLASGLMATLFALVLAAALNRFRCMRFCLWACLLIAAAQPLALLVASCALGGGIPSGIAGSAAATAVLAAGCSVFVVMAGALAVRLKPAPTAAATAAAVVAAFLRPPRMLLPDLNAFWLADRLVDGGAPSSLELLSALGAGIALVCVWLVVGSVLIERREIA